MRSAEKVWVGTNVGAYEVAACALDRQLLAKAEKLRHRKAGVATNRGVLQHVDAAEIVVGRRQREAAIGIQIRRAVALQRGVELVAQRAKRRACRDMKIECASDRAILIADCEGQVAIGKTVIVERGKPRCIAERCAMCDKVIQAERM